VRGVALALVLAACASPRAPQPAAPDPADPWPKPPAKTYSLPSEDPSHRSSRSLEQVLEGLDALTSRVGGYPARVASEAERDQLYAAWCGVVRDLGAVPLEEYRDETLYYAIHAETYRYGYNLGVRGAARVAEENLSYCLGADVVSDLCHRTRVALYLSEQPTNERFMLVEASLNTLRATQEEPDEKVEAGYVALRALSLDEPGTLAAIDHYLELFPEGESAERFREIREKLDQ
jgi:hypothetical protein